MEDESYKNVILLLVDNKLLKCTGNAFQDFFVEIASLVWGTDFEARRPQGQIGDKKCDGYHVPNKRVFQCYGTHELVGKKAADKIKEDFEGAKTHFGPDMEWWTFVHNHPDGLLTVPHETIIKLRKDNPGIKIDIMGKQNLMGLLIDLPYSRLKSIFTTTITPQAIRHVLYSDLDAVIEFVDGLQPHPSLEAPIAPSPEKVFSNNLPSYIEAILVQGQLAARKVEAYFHDTTRSERGERVAERFRREYRECKAQNYDQGRIFQRLIDLAGGLDCLPARQVAVLGLVAYFFHTCDVFENPKPVLGVPK